MCSISGIMRIANFECRNSDLEPALVVERMNTALRHRGPDDQGISNFELAPQPGCPSGDPAFRSSDFELPGRNQSAVNITNSEIRSAKFEIQVGLGNTRLAIIDLSDAGHQPMQDSDAGLTITYNGEIYNFRELRSEIGDAFGPWRSNTDTEVVLRAFRLWGVEAFAKLRGMFALGIWDAGRQELVVARDRFGIKPLYYSDVRGQRSEVSQSLVFASEVRALLATGLVERKLSSEGLASYLEYGSIQAPLTIIDGVSSLMPGHYLRIGPSDSGLQVSDYEFANLDRGFTSETQNAQGLHGEELQAISSLGVSSLEGNGPRPPRDRDEAVAVLKEKLTESVRLHLVSDVPLGVFLSGGMDSSALVALMRRVTKDKPKTFSVVFDEAQFSEAPHSRLVAEQFQTDHHEIHLSEDQLLGTLPPALAAMDQPTMDGVNTFVVSQAVKEAGVTVALSGLGGDELFAGYSTFRRAAQLNETSGISRRLLRTAASVRRSKLNGSVRRNKFWQLTQSDYSPAAVYEVSRQLFSSQQIEKMSDVRFRVSDLNSKSNGGGGRANTSSKENNPKSEFPNSKFDVVNQISLLELKGYMTNTLLRDTDCMSMAHSLEVRVPFVDSEVAGYVLGLPGQWKLNGSRPKPLLADIVSDLLPPKFLGRSKMGFTLPFEKWLQSGLRDQISDVFQDSERLIRSGLDSESVRNVWQRFQRSPASVGWSRPWSLYVLAKWCELNEVAMSDE
jgi:asparagine synthase (glutamine-hydrolysing)